MGVTDGGHYESQHFQPGAGSPLSFRLLERTTSNYGRGDGKRARGEKSH